VSESGCINKQTTISIYIGCEKICLLDTDRQLTAAGGDAMQMTPCFALLDLSVCHVPSNSSTKCSRKRTVDVKVSRNTCNHWTSFFRSKP